MIRETTNKKGVTQVTCDCDAYTFPHRVSSGDCQYAEYEDDCSVCVDSDGRCDVHYIEWTMHDELMLDDWYRRKFVAATGHYVTVCDHPSLSAEERNL